MWTHQHIIWNTNIRKWCHQCTWWRHPSILTVVYLTLKVWTHEAWQVETRNRHAKWTYANMFAKYNIVEKTITLIHFAFLINEVFRYIILYINSVSLSGMGRYILNPCEQGVVFVFNVPSWTCTRKNWQWRINGKKPIPRNIH